MDSELILASASPRRRALLDGLGAQFSVLAPGCDESSADALPPRERVSELARLKCAAVAAQRPAAFVVGADTMVLGPTGELLGKPRDTDDARRMLRGLSGRAHSVFTGVCVMHGGREYRSVEETRVFFRKLSEHEIERYLALGAPLDKAGAYGVQERGALFVERVEGDYFNVVGLPLVLTARLLAEAGYEL